MQTPRLRFTSGSPSTDFYHGADIVAQSVAGNYSVVRVSATAVNRGSTGSFNNSQGSHSASIDGYGEARYDGGLPGGYGNGQTRWDQTVDIAVGHDGNGNMGGVTLRQTVTGWFNNVQTTFLSGFPSISRARRPSPTSKPRFSNVLPTQVTVGWDFTGDQGGSPIDGYLVRYWPNAAGTGPYVDASTSLTEPRVVTGLTPGLEYRFVVYAHNGAADNNGYSNPSPAAIVTTSSGIFVKHEGEWRRAMPYIKNNGVWQLCSAFIKENNSWKRSG